MAASNVAALHYLCASAALVVLARAQRGIEALAAQDVAVLAPCIVAGWPERQRAPRLVLGTQGGQNVLAVDTPVVCPRAGAMAGQPVAMDCDLVVSIRVARAGHQIAPALGIARNDQQISAGFLKS